eukprot:gnl/Dysnectes_brevis/1449_a1640_1394.p1 GENE.gnl/Dysnectes_brevis/1449_a1640_1394~~gnl/Dysnectes_brevis/1449_a1640_1394.p1  ORF type:complete len:323 (-),score=72.79 gnl/Dysnectes_brevis/1449_a1640_1394:153-1064(-)
MEHGKATAKTTANSQILFTPIDLFGKQTLKLSFYQLSILSSVLNVLYVVFVFTRSRTEEIKGQILQFSFSCSLQVLFFFLSELCRFLISKGAKKIKSGGHLTVSSRILLIVRSEHTISFLATCSILLTNGIICALQPDQTQRDEDIAKWGTRIVQVLVSAQLVLILITTALILRTGSGYSPDQEPDLLTAGLMGVNEYELIVRQADALEVLSKEQRLKARRLLEVQADLTTMEGLALGADMEGMGEQVQELEMQLRADKSAVSGLSSKLGRLGAELAEEREHLVNVRKQNSEVRRQIATVLCE